MRRIACLFLTLALTTLAHRAGARARQPAAACLAVRRLDRRAVPASQHVDRAGVSRAPGRHLHPRHRDASRGHRPALHPAPGRDRSRHGRRRGIPLRRPPSGGAGGAIQPRPPVARDVGFGCISPDILHVLRRSENEISFPGCNDFPYPLVRCSGALTIIQETSPT